MADSVGAGQRPAAHPRPDSRPRKRDAAERVGFFGPPAFGLRLRGSSGQGIYLSA